MCAYINKKHFFPLNNLVFLFIIFNTIIGSPLMLFGRNRTTFQRAVIAHSVTDLNNFSMRRNGTHKNTNSREILGV